MADEVLINAQIYAGPVDLTGYSNQVQLDLKGDELDSTTFGSAGWHERLGGLRDVTMKHQGFVAWPNPDAEMFAELGVNNVPMTVATDLPTSSHVAYMFSAGRTEYSLLGNIGAIAPLVGTVMGDKMAGTARGKIGYANSVTGNSSGSVFTLPAVAAKHSLVVNIHVLAGGAGTVTVNSSADGSFDDTIARATAAVTSTGSQQIVVAGPITDLNYQIQITSVTGTISLRVGVGVS